VKIKNCIFVVFISICGLDVSAGKKDTFYLSLSVDTAFIPAIQYNSKTYQQFKKDKAYNYYHNKLKSDFSLRKLIHQILRKYFSLDLTETQTKVVLWVVVVVVVVIILLILYFFRPSWFYINKKKKIAFSVEDENIHHLDFERLIKDALESGRYANAIRWKYLQLLKVLHGKELISWDAHKTVIEYVYEIKQSELKSSFKEVSQQFLYYRYGNFEASRENWEQFMVLTTNIIKRI